MKFTCLLNVRSEFTVEAESEEAAQKQAASEFAESLLSEDDSDFIDMAYEAAMDFVRTGNDGVDFWIQTEELAASEGSYLDGERVTYDDLGHCSNCPNMTTNTQEPEGFLCDDCRETLVQEQAAE